MERNFWIATTVVLLIFSTLIYTSLIFPQSISEQQYNPHSTLQLGYNPDCQGYIVDNVRYCNADSYNEYLTTKYLISQLNNAE